MAKDVSVKDLEFLKAYNGKIKTFNTSVNTLLVIFRRKIENIISENKRKVGRLSNDYQIAREKINDKISKIENKISQGNWHPEALALLNSELQRVQSLGFKLDELMATASHDYNTLDIKLDQLMQTAMNFAHSNQTLLDSNIGRMNSVISHIETYKANSVK